ncbi:MAG: DUF5996 family protein [Candidatus Binatia bacterium]
MGRPGGIGEADAARARIWPPLAFQDWKDTYVTLHMWTQIVGKIRMTLTPAVNHWWHAPLYVASRGLTTSPMPCGSRQVEILFDFVDHELRITTTDGASRAIALVARPVAAFYREVMAALAELKVEVRISTMPVEVPSPIRFTDNDRHASYDPIAVERLFQVLVQTDTVFKEFRGRFLGKSSPVHFFWGAFDLAVTRFSGRRAPKREKPDPVMDEAYSHEVISHGFWPGGEWPGAGTVESPIFYAYAVPEPAGFAEAMVRPPQAFRSRELSEFVLPYDAVRAAESPRDALLEFMESTYVAGAELAHWDRAALERR